MASLMLKLHYFDLLEEELAERARENNKQQAKKSKRGRPDMGPMCSISQMEKIVGYMEINGDLSKLTHRGGGNMAGRSLADAGWKEITALVNNGSVGNEKTPLQLRRSWGDYKCKIRKKAAKLQEYLDLPVGRAPSALSPLELRVLALENVTDLSVEDPLASTVNGSEADTSEETNWQPADNVARHNLELPLPTTDIQIKKETGPIPSKSPQKCRPTITLIKVSSDNSGEGRNMSPENPLPLSNAHQQTSSKVQNDVGNLVVQASNNGRLTLKPQAQGGNANKEPNIPVINLDPPGSPDIEHMEMEREFAHLTELYEKTQTRENNNENKLNKIIEITNKKLDKRMKDVRKNTPEPKNTAQLCEKLKNDAQKMRSSIEKDVEKYLKTVRDRDEPKITKNHAPKHGTKRILPANGNLHGKENQTPHEKGNSSKKVKLTNIEDVVSLFLENMKEQRHLEMKREDKRMELEERRLENERESLRQRDVQLAQNAQILNVVVQLAELTERIMNKTTAI